MSNGRLCCSGLRQHSGVVDPSDPGTFVEGEVRRAIAELGVADFVYLPPKPAQGGSNQEVGDALLVANGRGGMLEVKARHRDIGSSDTPDKAAAWIKKHAQKAYDQAVGSIRNIDHHVGLGQPLRAVPYRTQTLTQEEQQQAALTLASPANDWPIVVVIDHPHANGVVPPDQPAFFITFDDLVELMATIRSVTGLLGYVDRVLEYGGPPIPLGQEHQRFSQLAAADAAYAAAGGPTTAPYLSWDARTDPLPVALYRELLERVWPESGRLPEVPLDDYRAIVEHLDAVPNGLQAEIGRSIRRRRDALRRDRAWQSGVALVEQQRAILYACDTHANYDIPDAFVARVAYLANARAVEFRTAYGRNVPTLGVGVLEGPEWLDYQYVLVVEPRPISQHDLLKVQHAYGRFDPRLRRVVELRPGRNDPCPCGSSKKYKRCCGA